MANNLDGLFTSIEMEEFGNLMERATGIVNGYAFPDREEIEELIPRLAHYGGRGVISASSYEELLQTTYKELTGTRYITSQEELNLPERDLDGQNPLI